MPKFKNFSGFGDPGNHLKSFDSQLSFFASDDEVYTRAFPSSLSGQPLKWFHKLPPDSTNCWQNIMDLFMEKFGASIVVDDDERTLLDIQQKPGETLRRYGPLKEKLVLEPPNTRNELFKLVIQYIKLEEVKLLSEEYSLKDEGSKAKDEVRRKSLKRGWVWDRLQRPEERETMKRQRARSPRREDGRQRIAGGGDTSNARRRYARRSVYALAPMMTIDLEPITFLERELAGLELPHDDPLVISPIIANVVVARMLVDTGSSTDILYLQAYDRLELPLKHLKPVSTLLTGSTRHSVYPTGIAELDLTVGEAPRTTTVKASFTVVDIPDPSYNGLIGRPLLNALMAVVSPLHLKMKFPTSGGVREISGDQKMEMVCYQLSIQRGVSINTPPRQKRKSEAHTPVLKIQEAAKDNDPKEKESDKHGEPHEELELVPFRV
ncbi:hypothetical protein LIER_03447 [Lithospermum erythrorhizon]|uniref:Retrotransposon gag domain-containing protein n=1 Tax=Lithospermum erythrorhizon TaxID=34254 RepID=A0AAV3NT61_LITER